ncbi:winged helix-turn-helix transcriptional regulator [Massilia norwichensis]|jgi:DNA-binding HxlR family transcriptional regulator|uniref:Helix-turn-helix transcriptional regulator n=1 Tax=Massilia norwichensis TaxID=1442366 RepID=A0ABT2A2I9_9BURK|nr:helix-turn-helix domain-containing protein [Massilia norwichensis]MCS0588391.1 helix-turn-helix transcriptional regulator [Massilia norwichensis]
MEPTCGLDVALHYVGGKWKPILLFHLQGAPRRFGELKRLVSGISEKVLIQQLRSLTEDGILTRHDFMAVPPRVEYAITDFGRTLALALQPLCEWGNRHRAHFQAQQDEHVRTDF